MSKHQMRILVLLVLLVGTVAACIEVGELKEDYHAVQLGGAKEAEARFKISAGEFSLSAGTKDLMEGSFAYNVDDWKPQIDYFVSGEKGRLTVEQPRHSGIPLGDSKNKWDVGLMEGVPIDLKVDFGAGEGHLDLRGIDLRDLDIDMGVGELTLDLTGELKDDLSVRIDGGVGSATLYLPEDIGVRVKVDGGIGSVDARGFIKNEHTFTNQAFGETDITIRIEIDAGIGSIDLRLK